MRHEEPIGDEEFADLMSVFGRFPPDEPSYTVGVAVSGGADSLCLAWLMRRWRRSALALIVDHGLRTGSDSEAVETAARLESFGMPAVILTLDHLDPGRRVQEQARKARYEILTAACLERGILDLALGHHERDQVETFLLRKTHGSKSHGLAAMAFARETPELRYLRPLLQIPPERLRTTLRAGGISWVEDPSNKNPVFERVRIRQSLDREARSSCRTQLAFQGQRRNVRENGMVQALAALHIDPLGFAVMETLPEDTTLLGRIWQVIGGSSYPPSSAILERVIASPQPVTFGGVQLCVAGRLGRGWMLAREPGAVVERRTADHGILWDRRFRLEGVLPQEGAVIAALGAESCRFRHHALPSVVLRGLPALWQGNKLVAVPLLGAFADIEWARASVAFRPAIPLSDFSFWPEYRDSLKT